MPLVSAMYLQSVAASPCAFEEKKGEKPDIRWMVLHLGARHPKLQRGGMCLGLLYRLTCRLGEELGLGKVTQR